MACLRLQFGRVRRRLFILLAMVLALLFLSSAAAIAGSLLLDGGSVVDITLAVAIEDDDETLEKALLMIAGVPEVSGFATILYDTPERVVEYVRRGEAAAAIIFPAGFMQSVYTGENMPPRLVLDTSQAMEALLVMKLAQSGVRLLTASQQGYLYTLHVYDLMRPDEPARDIVDYEASMKFYLWVVGCGEMYQRLAVSATGALDTMQHYLISAVLFFTMLALPVLYPIFSFREQREWLLRLRASGCPRTSYALAQIIGGFFAISAMLILLLCGIALIGNEVRLLAALPAALLCALFFSCYGFLCNNTGSILSAVGINFVLAALMLLSFGGLLPLSFLPAPIAALAPYSPLGWMHAALSTLFGADGGLSWLWILIGSLLLLAIAMLYARVKERRAS